LSTDAIWNITVTVGEMTLGHHIAQHLLERHLAASVQVVGPIVSHYWWQGERHEAREFQCQIKAPAAHYAAIEQAVTAMHPYAVPEIFAVPILAAPENYRRWIDENTRGGER